METQLRLSIRPQPSDATCGPTCLHAVYRYHGDVVSLSRVLREVPTLSSGGTLEVLLACHALRRGYQARIYSYNLHLFDPSWFDLSAEKLAERLQAQARFKRNRRRLAAATKGYLEFLRLGGEVRFEDLTTGLIRSHLVHGTPILTGLSSTYLYRVAREHGPMADDDDLRGEPTGHFVVLCGYDKDTRQVLVADPLQPNPVSAKQHYLVGIDRVLCAVLLGIVTYDASLLVIRPPAARRRLKKD